MFPFQLNVTVTLNYESVGLPMLGSKIKVLNMCVHIKISIDLGWNYLTESYYTIFLLHEKNKNHFVYSCQMVALLCHPQKHA